MYIVFIQTMVNTNKGELITNLQNWKGTINYCQVCLKANNNIRKGIKQIIKIPKNLLLQSLISKNENHANKLHTYSFHPLT